MLLLGLTGLLTGILQSYDEFTIPAISPAVWNLVIIVLLVTLAPHFHGREEIYAYAIGILAATGVQLGLAFGALGRIDFRLQFHIDWHDPRIKQVFMLMLPVTIGLGIVNLDQLINSAFGSLVSERSAARDRQRVSHLHAPAGHVQRGGRHGPVPDPQPSGRRAATRRAMRRTVGTGMRQINLLLIPAAAFMIVLADADHAARCSNAATSTTHRLIWSRCAVLVCLQPALRRHQPAAHANLLRAAATLDPDAAGGDEHRRGHHRQRRLCTSRWGSPGW